MRYLLALICLYANTLNAQCDWTLAKAISGSANNTKIATDKKGNVFVYGDFSDVLTVGSFQIGVPWMNGCFVAKMDPLGNFVWVVQVNGASVTTSGIAVDAKSNVILTGYMSGYVSMGIDTIKNEGFFDAFIAKLDSNGNFRWLNGIQGQELEGPGFQIATDGLENIYFTCDVSNGSKYKTDTVKSHGYADAGIYKIDSDGNLLWRKVLGGSKQDGASGITRDQWGNIYVVGTFTDTLFADLDTLVTNNHFSTFLAKYNANGNLIWVKEQPHAIGTAIVVDRTGGVFVIGSFSDTAVFGQSIIATVPGKDSRFLAKYDSAGHALWGLNAGVGLYQTGKFGVDNLGCVYLPSALGKAVTKVDGNGNVLWTKYPGGIAETNDLCLDGLGDIYITGNLSGPAYFIPFTLNIGTPGVFIARLFDSTSVGHPRAQELSISPNPASSKLNIRNADGITRMRLFDMMGKLVHEEKLRNSNSHIVDVANVIPGIYIIELSGFSNASTQEIQISH